MVEAATFNPNGHYLAIVSDAGVFGITAYCEFKFIACGSEKIDALTSGRATVRYKIYVDGTAEDQAPPVFGIMARIF